MQNAFYELADALTAELHAGEVLLLNFSGEESDFIRFNHGKVRQPGSVRQAYVSVHLIDGSRHARATVGVAGKAADDLTRCKAALVEVRALVALVSEDPHLLYATDVHSTEAARPNQLPPAQEPMEAILDAAGNLDFVGIHAQGRICSGFANSLGQRNWFSSHSFILDWSLYHQADKAVKTTYAGYRWDGAEFARKSAAAAHQLEILARPAKTIAPGNYRAYFEPAALGEFLQYMCYGGFSLKAQRTKTTPLLKMIEGGATLSPAVSLREATAEGLAPNFESNGFVKPDSVQLAASGRLVQPLVSARSAKEFSVPTNAANGGEHPESLDMAVGDVADGDILSRLDTGIYMSRLWYLNYSDRPAGRITGMTRFATFWVEVGRIVAPVNVMRFDDTAYHVLGDNLLGLTAARELIVGAGSYGGRGTSSARLPGAIVKDFVLTL